MTNKQVGRRRFLGGEFYRTVYLFVGAPALALLLAALPLAAHSDDPDTIPTDPASLGVFKRNGSGNSLSDFERQLLAGCCLSLMQPFGSANGRL